MRKEAAAEWRRLVAVLVEMKVLTAADLSALRAVCEAWADYRAAQTVAAKKPYYKTKSRDGSEMIRAHPAVADRSDAWRRYRAGLVEFGLTPASRSRVSAVEGGNGKPAAGPQRLEDWMRSK
ncbi:MAG: phage terminase small subunit P27 family [Myxococcales bacterium]|nr:phage terminase small subunit P27 family [Myxococcales bacterium]